MDGYAFVHSEHVRFRDLDAMGHINNAVIATYIEQARVEYLASLNVLDGPVYDQGAESMILARIEIDFRAPGHPEPDMVDIGVRPTSVGRKSFTLDYRLEQGGELLAEASTVLASYDYERGRSREVPDDWRNALERPGPVSA
jgi:acyl-CoA thioester hydrolase